MALCTEQISHGLAIVFSSTTKDRAGKIEYRFGVIHNQSLLGEFGGRFSELENIHSNIRQFAERTGAAFPGKNIFYDMTTPANVLQRGTELTRYFAALLRYPNASVPAIWEGLRLPGPVRQALAEYEAAAQAAANAQAAAAAAQAAAIEQAIQSDVAMAQRVNTLPTAPGCIPVLAYDHAQVYTLRTRIWSYGDIAIKGGPRQFEYFRVRRSDGVLFANLLKNAAFTICSMVGEPLLVLQEEFAWMSYVYRIHRVLPGGGLMHLCTVRGVHIWAADVYEVEVAGALAGAMRISCQGQWINRLSLLQTSCNGVVEAALVERQIMSLSETYTVSLAPGSDTLLYLGIACAIDRIHHEIEEKHRRAVENRREVEVGAAGLIGVVVGAEMMAGGFGHHHHRQHHGFGHHHHHGHHGGHHH